MDFDRFIAQVRASLDAQARKEFNLIMDYRVIGYGNVPFLNVLCDGRRVKL